MPTANIILRTLLVLAGLCLWDQVVEAQDFDLSERPLRAAKTLFTWSGSAPVEDDGDDRIVTDRPHISEASSLVGLGRVQVEGGYSYFRDRQGGTFSEAHTYPETLWRIGLFREWFEFRIAYNNVIETTIDPTIGTTRFAGIDDMYLGAKLALTEQSGILPEVAFFPQMLVPLGTPGISNRGVLPGFNLAYSWEVTDWLEIEANTLCNKRRDAVEHFYAEFAQTLNFEWKFTESFEMFTEWLLFSPAGAIAANTEHYYHMGFAYQPTKYLQFDIHSGVGLNRAAVDLAFTGAGVSYKW